MTRSLWVETDDFGLDDDLVAERHFFAEFVEHGLPPSDHALWIDKRIVAFRVR
jgi:hypothetical protein